MSAIRLSIATSHNSSCKGAYACSLTCYYYYCYYCYSIVGIVTGYGLDGRGVGVRIPLGSRIFSSPRRPDGL
jgi:hypothetical protein